LPSLGGKSDVEVRADRLAALEVTVVSRRFENILCLDFGEAQSEGA